MKVEKLLRLFGDDEAFPDALESFRSAYAALVPDEKRALFSLLLTRMEVVREAIERPLRDVLDDGSNDPLEWTSALTKLRRALESPRMRAFRRFLNLEGGLKFLLDLRADVLDAERRGGETLAPLDEEIAHLFNSWFQYGFLFIHEITQDSSFRQIQFLKDHDMVHPMASLEEMGARLGADRRSFALYHRVMPEQPIVFIEVALTRRIPASIHEILDGARTEPVKDPDTAIFYSINNAQNGLAGLGLGKLLIFQVVEAIKKSEPSIRTFATLSPVPGFWGRYLKPILEGEDRDFELKRDQAAKKLGGTPEELLARLSDPRFIEDRELSKRLARPLRDIAFLYLTKEKNRLGKPLNPVAGFHFGNWARLSLKNVHFGANRSERGLRDSLSVMASYVYSSTWLHELRRSARAYFPWDD